MLPVPPILRHWLAPFAAFFTNRPGIVSWFW